MKLMPFLYILSVALLTIFSFAFIDRNLTLFNKFFSGFSIESRGLTTAFFLFIVVFLYILYGILLFRIYKRQLTSEQIKRILMIVIGILVFSYPAMLSYDIFNYIMTAKVVFFYHENPYIVMPIEFLGDPNLVFTRAANKIALYGPSWVLLTSIPYVLSFGNIILSIFSFKAFIALFYLATVWLIWKASQNKISVALFALNPLVIIETLISGHNDIVMMFFALLSFYLLKKDKIIAAFFALLTSILIKYATVLLLPIFLFMAYRAWKKRVVNWDLVYMAAAIAMFFVFLIAPFREEIYPWYVIWILSFAVLIPRRKFLLVFVMVLSFAVLLRYIPVLYTGSYRESTPLIKEIVTFVPLGIVCVFWLCKSFFWKKSSR